VVIEQGVCALHHVMWRVSECHPDFRVPNVVPSKRVFSAYADWSRRFFPESCVIDRVNLFPFPIFPTHFLQQVQFQHKQPLGGDNTRPFASSRILFQLNSFQPVCFLCCFCFDLITHCCCCNCWLPIRPCLFQAARVHPARLIRQGPSVPAPKHSFQRHLNLNTLPLW